MAQPPAPDRFMSLFDAWRAARTGVDQRGLSDLAADAVDNRLRLATRQVLAHRAATPDQIADKLTVLIAMAPIECGDDDEFPWPQLKIIRDELANLERPRSPSPDRLQ